MDVDVFEKYGIELPTIEDADAVDNPKIVAKFTTGEWDWYVIGGDKLKNRDYYLYGLVDGIYRELGMFTLSQIQSVGASLSPNFEKIGLYDLIGDLDNKKGV